MLEALSPSYLVGSVKFVKQTLISSGSGWLDADPEIRQIRPDFYVVNEDGDKVGKREYCRKLGIEYPNESIRRRSLLRDTDYASK